MHELIISPHRAMALALTETGLDREQVFRVHCTLDGGLYDIRFCTDWLRYQLYLDAESGEVLGLDTEPMGDAEVQDSQSTGVFWKIKYNIIAAEN
ncbi:MAG: hypothetical protein SPE18_04885 [Candidatus Limivicinus sp.]|nr:hypothetical protein [Candidatus Limivicinus sp.]